MNYIAGAKVGHSHTTLTPQPDGLVRIDSQEVMTIQRGGLAITNRVTLLSVEKPTGELSRFESRADLGPTETQSRGEVLPGGKLRLETGSQGQTTTETIPWHEDWGGFFAADRSLEARPMKPGESRTLHSLQPIVNQVAEIELKAADFEETQLLTGSRRLLRIEGQMTLAGVPITMTLWTDEQGVSWKTFVPNLNQTSYRADRETALRQGDGPAYDLFADVTVHVAQPLKKGHDSQRVLYRAKLAGADPAEAFVSDTNQSVQRIDEHTAEITVRAVRPNQPPGPLDGVQPPTDADRAPNTLIQSDDPRIVQMAASVEPEETDPWKIGLALEKFVRGAVTEKNFSQAFASAAEVAQTREGDCTEHAVLLTALLRARNIPARCAMGLVYFPQDQGAGFAYHMWSEAWINDRWIPLDGTLGRGGIGGGHLELAHSNLQGAGPFAAFMPVFRVLGQLELEVVRED